MVQPPGARFGHGRIEHQMDIARRGWAKERDGMGAGRYRPGEAVRSVAVLLVILAVMGVVVLLAWSSGLFASP
jgi:hypothetical protein